MCAVVEVEACIPVDRQPKSGDDNTLRPAAASLVSSRSCLEPLERLPHRERRLLVVRVLVGVQAPRVVCGGVATLGVVAR